MRNQLNNKKINNFRSSSIFVEKNHFCKYFEMGYQRNEVSSFDGLKNSAFFLLMAQKRAVIGS